VLLISGAGRINPNAARAAGAAGFISKDWPAADIAGAVRMVGLGMTVFRPNEAPTGPPLTEREREVLELVGRGRSNHEIADDLVVAEATVKTHISRLLAKTGSRDRVQLVVLAYETGIVRPA
jgi:two-component system response regulator DesR